MISPPKMVLFLLSTLLLFVRVTTAANATIQIDTTHPYFTVSFEWQLAAE
jgi:hypothetical protein